MIWANQPVVRAAAGAVYTPILPGRGQAYKILPVTPSMAFWQFVSTRLKSWRLHTDEHFVWDL
jgi:hypothetical protein